MTATSHLSLLRIVLIACVLAGMAYLGLVTTSGIETVASTTPPTAEAAMVSPVMVETEDSPQVSSLDTTSTSRVNWILMEGAKAGKQDAIRIIEQAAADGDVGARKFLRTLRK